MSFTSSKFNRHLLASIIFQEHTKYREDEKQPPPSDREELQLDKERSFPLSDKIQSFIEQNIYWAPATTFQVLG